MSDEPDADAINASIARLTAELIHQHEPADAMLVITGVVVNLICLCSRPGREETVAQLLLEDILTDIPRRRTHYANIRQARPSDT